MTEPGNKKDRDCPFCRQRFTASSLGRHLDTFIKEKRPKVEDDVHDVQEIKKLRAGITRRQPRKSLRRRTPISEDALSVLSEAKDSQEKSIRKERTFKTYLNQAGWEATGVINDVSRSTFKDSHVPRERSTTGSLKNQIGRKESQVDLVDRARAAELALQEVLESLKVAKWQSSDVERPFEFNFHALSLPQLYLRCLGPPPNLLSKNSQRLGELTWSVQPPSTTECEDLRAWLAGKMSDWKRRCENSPGYTGSDASTGQEESLRCVRRAEAGYYVHLESMFSAWSKMSETERQETWHLECVRALALVSEEHQDTKLKLEKAELETHLLRARLEQIVLNKGDADWLSDSRILPLSHQAVNRLATDELNYSVLISKWKTRLQCSRNTQHPSPPLDGSSRANGHTILMKETSKSDRPNTLVHGQEDDYLEDAEGEVDSEHLADGTVVKELILSDVVQGATAPLLDRRDRCATATELG